MCERSPIRSVEDIERDLLAVNLTLALDTSLSEAAQTYGRRKAALLEIELKGARGREIAKRAGHGRR